MGQLRNSITSLATLMAAAAKKGPDIANQLEAKEQNVIKLFQVVEGGCDVLYQYLEAKLQKSGIRYDTRASDKLSNYKDANVEQFIKGIEAAVRNVQTALASWKTTNTLIPAEYARMDQYLREVNEQIEKKKGKWIQSSKYKDKIRGYEKAVEELEAAIATRKQALTQVQTPINENSLAQMRLTMNSTLGDVKNMATMSIQQGLKNLQAQIAKGDYVKRAFRENGDLQEAHTTLAKWAQDADDMEQANSVAARTGPRKLRNLTINNGSTTIGKAASATFTPNGAFEVSGVQWTTGLDPLKFLQKKVTIHGKYEDSKEGEFTNDMRLDGIKGGTTAKFVR